MDVAGRRELLTLAPPFRLPSKPLLSQSGTGARVFHYDLPLSGIEPILNRDHSYELEVQAGDLFCPVSVSRPFYFRAVDAVAPVPPTITSVNKVLGPDWTITSITMRDRVIVASGTCSKKAWNSRLSLLLGREVLPVERRQDASNPGRDLFTVRVSTAERRVVQSIDGILEPAK